MTRLRDVIQVPASRAWLPEGLRRPGSTVDGVRFSAPERKIFRKHKPIPVSRWAEAHRTVTMSVLPGRWRNDVTPYLSGIMDASFFPSVQTVILCAAPQVGKTEAVLNCLAYAIDRDPGPALCIYPDELTGKENSQDRIRPMIQASPQLRRYLTGTEDDAAILRISLQHMPIYIAWARSAARLANKPIRFLIFDEVDKYPETAGKREADPISLGLARTNTFRHNRKVWKISTPTTEAGNIWQALTTEAQAIFDCWVTCPACGHHHRMAFASIRWKHRDTPGEDGACHSENPETIEAEKLAWYCCPACEAQWNDYDRDLAVRKGCWRARPIEADPPPDIEAPLVPAPMPLALAEYLRVHRPVKIGFHLPSWISPFVSLADVAAAFLRGLSDLNKFKDFHNKHLAEPWKRVVVSKTSDEVLGARCDLPPQTAPEAAVALTAGIDVQQTGFWFAVRAWAPDLTSWLVHYGYLATWAEVESLLFDAAYPVGETGRSLGIFRACVDTGGGKKYEDMTMTEETYFWLATQLRRGGCAVWGSKGASSPLPGMLALGNAILSTPSGKKLADALRLISVDTGKGKDQYHYRLKMAARPESRSLPGAAFLHADTGVDYAAQVLAEEKQVNERGNEEWVNPHQRPNHLLDCEVLAAACVEMEFPGGGLRLLAESARRRSAGPPPPSKPKNQKPKPTSGGRW